MDKLPPALEQLRTEIAALEQRLQDNDADFDRYLASREGHGRLAPPDMAGYQFAQNALRAEILELYRKYTPALEELLK